MRDIMLIVHLLSIAMFVGAGFSALVLNKAVRNMERNIIDGYNKISLTLNYLSKTGLTLLVITGGYLMTPYWAIMGQMPLLLTKLILAVVVIVLLVLLAIYAKKAKKTNDDKYFAKVNSLQLINLLAGIVIIILAVLVFH